VSSRLYGRSAGSSVGGIAIVAGLLGAACSSVLWIRERDPHNGIVKFVTDKLFAGTDSWNGLITIAAVAGGLGLMVAILGVIKSRDRGGTSVVGLILSLLALSYPFAYLAQQVAQPFTKGGPLGRA
jgi:hypothetical protein